MLKFSSNQKTRVVIGDFIFKSLLPNGHISKCDSVAPPPQEEEWEEEEETEEEGEVVSMALY